MIERKTLKQIATDLANKKYSSTELTQDYLDRIDKANATLNCYITVHHAQALADARAADQRLAKGEGQPLTGVPIAHKDIFCTAGHKTSCGSKMLDNFIAPYDATLVQRYKQQTAVLLGKTNMDEFAMGSSNETSYYGCVRNPWDTSRVAGGSSGGSAAAVAAGLAAASTGTDTGGSIRQPAAFCGLTGLKPTYGRVSRFGMIAFASSLDQAGVFTLTAEDAALMLQVMAGFDPADSTSIQQDVPDYCATLNAPLHGLRIGLPKEYFNAGLAPHIAATIHEALREYEKLGATLHEISLPNTHLAVPVYYIVAPAECSSNLSRYDGVRYGYRCTAPRNIQDLYCRSRGEGFGAEVKRRIMLGTYALSSGYYDAYYTKAQKIRRLIHAEFQQAFTQVDIIASPTTPNVAFLIGEKVNDPVSMYLNDIYTISANLAGLPALSLPAGLVDKLPLGLQLIGNHFSEARLLNAAHQFQQATAWHWQTPNTGA